MNHLSWTNKEQEKNANQGAQIERNLVQFII